MSQQKPIVFDEDSGDSFDGFPEGAVRYSMEELLERMEARRNGTLREDLPVETQQGADGIEAFRQEEPGEDDPTDADEQTPILVGSTPRIGGAGPSATSAQELKDIADVLLPQMRRFVEESHDQAMSLTTKLTKGADGFTEVTWTISKTPTKEEPAKEEPVTDSQASSVFTSPRRRLRVVQSDDDDSSQETQNDYVTPKKKKAAQQVEQPTPSPAKRMRGMNLNVDSESDSEDDEEELPETDPELSDEDETRSQSIADSQVDPEYFPDTQEQKDRPSDFRIPRSAPKDPLDLEY